MRLLLQSVESFQFLYVSPRNGDVTWTPSLVAALRHGVVADLEQAAQLIEDHADRGSVVVVDLDEGRD